MAKGYPSQIQVTGENSPGGFQMTLIFQLEPLRYNFAQEYTCPCHNGFFRVYSVGRGAESYCQVKFSEF